MRLSILTLLATLLSLTAPLHSAPITPEESLAYLREWEGVRSVVYRDAGGYSVGVGHWLGRARPAKTHYTQIEILSLFYRDLAIHHQACRRGIRDFDELPKEVQKLCLGLAWTVGPAGFRRFTNFRRAISHRAYQSAAAELVDSRWWSQVSPARRMASYRTLTDQP